MVFELTDSVRVNSNVERETVIEPYRPITFVQSGRSTSLGAIVLVVRRIRVAAASGTDPTAPSAPAPYRSPLGPRLSHRTRPACPSAALRRAVPCAFR